MLFIVVVVIVAALWVSTKHQSLISVFKNEELDQELYALKQVRKRLLNFATLQPEIYMTDSGSGNLEGSDKIPGVGYFPCPDLDGDGQTTGVEDNCGNPLLPASAEPQKTGFVPDPYLNVGLGSCNGAGVCTGYVPREISTYNIYFAPAGRYFYFLDERFSTQNTNYNNVGGVGPKRYAPLYPNRLGGDPLSATSSTDSFDPVLTLNGVGGYVAIIIDAGDDGLDAANNDGDYNFVSGTPDLSDSEGADQIVGITYEDWIALMAHRVCVEKGRIEGVDADYTDIDHALPHWYNDYNATTNPSGGNWRTWGIVCP
ncbi:hypothetical protein QCB45_10575 [Thiomicrorhabdus sp. ZW0627]|nr:hypothetical protein [Thiomicrorhabdus sp. ZW0627]